MKLSYHAPPALEERNEYLQLLGRLGPLIGVVFVFVLFTILSNVIPDASQFATFDNLKLMLRQTAVVGIASLGMTMIIISGGIDLSVGSVIALSTVTITMVLRSSNGTTPMMAALTGIATAAAAGLLIGLMVTQLRLSPFIATLGLWGSLRGVAEGMAGNSRIHPYVEPKPGALLVENWRSSWLSDLINALPDNRKWMLFPPGVWLMIVLAVLVWAILRYTRFGRHVFAIGSNEQTARLCGVPIVRTKILIYVLAGALVGIASILEFSWIGAGDPTGRLGAELDVIAAVVIGGASLSGGQGSVVGSLLGALMMTMVANGCTKLNWENWVQKIATGGIIVVAATLDQIRQRKPQ